MTERGTAVLVASFCTVFAGFAIRFCYGVLLPEMLPALVISKTEAGLIYSSFFISYTVFSPVLGMLADRTDVRVLLSLFSAVLGIGTFLMAYSSSLFEASVFFGLAGIGGSCCWSPVVALAQRWVSDKRRGITLAFIDAGGSLGIVASSIAMPLVVLAHGWRTGWKIMGIVAFLAAGMNFFLVRSHPVGMPDHWHSELSPHAGESVTAMCTSILGDSRFWLIGLSYLLIGFSVLIPATFLPTYAVQELMLPYDIAARFITVIAATGIVGKLVVGSLSDALGRVRMMMLCAALTVAGDLGILYYRDLLMLSVSTFIFGFAQGPIWPLYAACASDYFSKRSAGSIVGFWTLLVGIGFVLSPIVAGWTADVTGTFTWSFFVAMATALMSLFLLLPLRKAPAAGNSPGS